MNEPLAGLQYPEGGSSRSAPGSSAPGQVAQAISTSELETRSPGGAAPLMDVLSNALHPLRKVKAKLTVCVGSAEISLGELLGAREQHLLRLNRTVDQPVDVLLEGQVVARGTLVAVDDHFAVRITDLPESFDEATSGPLGR